MVWLFICYLKTILSYARTCYARMLLLLKPMERSPKVVAQSRGKLWEGHLI